MTSNTATLAQPRWPVDAPAATGADGPAAHYLITLTTAILPLREVLPRLPVFAEARVFCERYVDAGTTRVRVQLGFFRSMRAAAEAMRAVQADYPHATVRAVRPLAGGDRAPARAGAAPSPGGFTAVRRETPADTAIRRFAVELLWSPQPIDLAHVPPLTLFDGHTLYAVAAHRGGHDWHGLRLGFFTDRVAAMAAVDEATTYFSGAIAVPVSDSEFDKASAAEIRPFAARIGIVSFASM